MPYVSCLQVFLCLYLPRDWWILSLFVTEWHVYLEMWKCLVLIDSIFLLYLYYSYCLYWCHMWFYCLVGWYLILSHQCSLFSIDRYFVLFACYVRLHPMLLSVKTMSWSDSPGSGLHLLTSDGLLVKNRSNVLVFLVGKLTTCSRDVSLNRSRYFLLNDFLYWVPVIFSLGQSMSLRLKSPPIQTVPLLLLLHN